MLLTKIGDFWAVAHISNQTIVKTLVMDEQQGQACFQTGGVLFPWIRWEENYVSDFHVAPKGSSNTHLIREAMKSVPRGMRMSLDDFRDVLREQHDVFCTVESIKRVCEQNPYPLIFPSHRIACSKTKPPSVLVEKILAYEQNWIYPREL